MAGVEAVAVVAEIVAGRRSRAAVIEAASVAASVDEWVGSDP